MNLLYAAAVISRTKTERRKMKIRINRRHQIGVVPSLNSGRVHCRSEVSLMRLAIAGLLVFAAAGLPAMSMKPPKLPWVPPLIPAAFWPVHIMVDQATNTIYVANQLDDTISVVDGKKCDSKHSSHCTPITVIAPGPNPTDLLLDAAHRTLFCHSVRRK